MAAGFAPQPVALNATAVSITWDVPTEPNGRILRYELAERIVGGTSNIIFSANQGFTATSVELKPFTTYEYQLRVRNEVGLSVSSFVQVVTEEAGKLADSPIAHASVAPEGLSAPALVTVEATSMVLSWSEPLQANGRILSYEILGAGVTASFSGNDNAGMVAGLIPFTNYEISLQACNSAGCIESSTVTVMTLDAGESSRRIVLADHVNSPDGLGSPICCIPECSRY